MRRAIILSSFLLIANLTACANHSRAAEAPPGPQAATDTTPFEGVQVVAGQNLGRVNVMVTKDSGRLSMLMNGGSAFAIRTDPATMAAWADSVALSRDTIHGTRLTCIDQTRQHREQAITFVRLSMDSNSMYRITGEDGARTGSLTLAADTARVVFGAMRGQQQQTRAARFMVHMAALGFVNEFRSHSSTELPRNPSFFGPRIRHAVAAHYPENLRQARLTGNVVLSFMIDTTGHVDRKTIEVVSSASPEFTDAAEDALLLEDFVPAMDHGHPVLFRTTQAFAFTLSSQ